ncbi:MAG: VOC family protein, partial [Solirubrobacteraceae bacterium]
MRIDHVLWRTEDLDAAAERMRREHGLRAVGGGRHEGMGTHNRIVPLDGHTVVL